MSDAPGDNKPKPIFNPDDVVEPDSPRIDFGADTKVAKADDKAEKADTKADKAEAKADAANAKVEAAEAKADAAAAKAHKEAKADAMTASGTAAGAVKDGDSEFAGREVVYVQAPVPPRPKGNRGIGSLLAVLGAAVFAAVFAGACIVAFFLKGDSDPMNTFALFIQSAIFWVPVLVFLVAFVLLVLLVNRAGWAAHVFGSLLVAVAVYFGSIGILLAVAGISAAATGDAGETFGGLAVNPFIIIAALVAREVSIWVGLAIAARGRRVKARNHEIVDEWEREHADTRAQYERASST
jgi:hypothetical protein